MSFTRAPRNPVRLFPTRIACLPSEAKVTTSGRNGTEVSRIDADGLPTKDTKRHENQRRAVRLRWREMPTLAGEKPFPLPSASDVFVSFVRFVGTIHRIVG
jgi:hypothetical protein